MNKKINLLLISITLTIISCNREFNQEEWKKYPEKRSDMVIDLSENVLIGMNKTDIIKILGKPNTEYFKDANLVYYIGPEKSLMGVNIDSEWLLIYLDSNKVFDYYEIKTD